MAGNARIDVGGLVQAESMPDRLKDLPVDRKMWNAVQQVRDKYHRMGFALRFWEESGLKIDANQLVQLVQKNCKTNISKVCTGLVYWPAQNVLYFPAQLPAMFSACFPVAASHV